MTASFFKALLIIAVAAVCTFATRLLPFILFGGKRGVPKAVKYLGAVLPPAIIAVLIVYCLKGIVPLHLPTGIAEIISVIVVAVLHIWKRSTLVSIAGGTLLYMVLIRLI